MKVVNNKKIIVFSDVHYSAFWDEVEQLSLEHKFINANKNLSNLITKINEDSGVLGVINNGDSVDYYFTDYFLKIKKDADNNWDKYNKEVSRINKNYFENIGNHEYRLMPYNIGLYGLPDMGVNIKDLEHIRSKIGHDSFRWLGELSSLFFNQKKFDPLNKSNGIRSVVYHKIKDFNCIFINTGSDAFVCARNTIKYLFKFFIRLVLFIFLKKDKSRHLISHDLDGVSKKDIASVEQLIDKNNDKNLLFFMHAPIINPCISNIGKKYNLKLSNFHMNIILHGAAEDIMFNGGGLFLKLLSDEKNKDINFTIIASHIHNAKYFLINKQTLIAEEVTIEMLNESKNNPMYIKHLTTLGLGAVGRKSNNKERGYLEISEDGFKEVIVDLG
jgi:hypothetical protein